MTDSTIVKERLIRAALTLKSLPHDPRERPQGFITAWPDMIRQSKKGQILKRGNARFSPNNRDITDLYKIIDALYNLTEFQLRLLWARAVSIPWKSLQHKTGKSRTHLNRLHQNALIALQAELEKLDRFKNTG